MNIGYEHCYSSDKSISPFDQNIAHDFDFFLDSDILDTLYICNKHLSPEP